MPSEAPSWRSYFDRNVYSGPVAILLTDHEDRHNAATISFFSEVAHHPTTLWVSLEANSYSWELMQKSGHFTLCVLREGQADLALACASRSGRDFDKRTSLTLFRDPERGFPVVEDCLASAWCRVRSAHPAGAHTVVVADILAGTINSGAANRRHLLTSDVARAIRD